MAQLPNIGQDWQNFQKFLPGFQGANNANGALSINGNMPNYFNIMADGGSVILPHSDNFDVAIFETVQEVQIQTSTFSAQYGIGGAVFNQISKGGTNQLHGAGYEYLRNDFFNCAQHLQPGGEPEPLGQLRRLDRRTRHQEQDVLLLQRRQDHQQRWILPLQQLSDRSGPLRQLLRYRRRQADLVPESDLRPAISTVVTGPACSRVRPSRTTPFRTNRFSPVAVAAQALWPVPNVGVANQVSNNYQAFTPSINPFLKYFGRLDYNISDSNRLTFSITERDNPGIGYSVNCPSNCNPFDIDSQQHPAFGCLDDQPPHGQ